MLPKIESIVYPTDLSMSGGKVLRHVVALAEAHDAKVVLLHVVEPLSANMISVVDGLLPDGAPTAEQIRNEGLATLRKNMYDKVHQFYLDEVPPENHGEPEIHVVEGSPAKVILEEAEKLKASMIVMGTHGHSLLGELVLGSVALKVIHKSTIPVLLVPYPKS